ncbi:hypothetical protein AB6D11_06495 [Vibrio splendidus]
MSEISKNECRIYVRPNTTQWFPETDTPPEGTIPLIVNRETFNQGVGLRDFLSLLQRHEESMDYKTLDPFLHFGYAIDLIRYYYPDLYQQVDPFEQDSFINNLRMKRFTIWQTVNAYVNYMDYTGPIKVPSFINQ